MEELYEENWYKKWQKEAILGKFLKWYRYRNRAVPVPPIRGQLVAVPIQAGTGTNPAECNRYRLPIRAVPVPQCPKCPDLCVFV